MRVQLVAVMALLVSSIACTGGEQVALNERLFDRQSMESEGGGCSLYELGGGAQVSSSGSALEFTVSQRLDDKEVVVEVQRGSAVVAVKRYGASFFGAGSVDEFVAPSLSGKDLLLRHWGTMHPNGIDGCAPLDQASPSPP